jgi:hypothetical protein
MLLDGKDDLLGKRVGKEVPLSRAKRVLAAVFVSAAMLAAMVTPALAHIHFTIPADECAPPEQAANNAQGIGNNPAQDPPVGNVENAPTECPAPQK